MCLILPVGTLIAWKLGSVQRFRGQTLVDTLLLLPLALPPTVVGFTLLMLLGRGTTFGVWLNDRAGIQLVFTWLAGALAAAIIGGPLYIRSAATAFREIDRDLLEVAAMFGASRCDVAKWVVLPIAKRGLLAGFALAFARALGEFGATIMVAGNIPGSTQTLPLALFSAASNGEDRTAIICAVLLTSITLILAILITSVERRKSIDG